MPITRYHNYLESVGLWCEQQDTELKKQIKNSVLLAFTEAEKEHKACWKELFTDVYRTMPKHIRFVCLFIFFIRMAIYRSLKYFRIF